jgi:hypothetical protein
MKEIRYHIEVEGAKGFLAPLSFPVAEAALGFVFQERPKYLSAGEIVINSLWVKGSPTLQAKGEHFDQACLQAYATIQGIEYKVDGDEISIPYKEKKDGVYIPKTFKCKINEKIKRETLEDCLSLMMPNVGNPRPLTAGRMIVFENWISGDEEIKENDELLIAASLACYYVLKLKQSSIKKV